MVFLLISATAGNDLNIKSAEHLRKYTGWSIVISMVYYNLHNNQITYNPHFITYQLWYFEWLNCQLSNRWHQRLSGSGDSQAAHRMIPKPCRLPSAGDDWRMFFFSLGSKGMFCFVFSTDLWSILSSHTISLKHQKNTLHIIWKISQNTFHTWHVTQLNPTQWNRPMIIYAWLQVAQVKVGYKETSYWVTEPHIPRSYW